MIKGSEPTPKLDAAVAQVHEALERLVEALGPRRCPHASEWFRCEEDGCRWDDTQPLSHSLALSEWAIATIWTDLETGVSYVNFKAPSNQFRTHTIGLLSAVLDVQ